MDAAACRAFHIMKAEMSAMREYVQRVGLKGLPPFGGWEHLRKYDLKNAELIHLVLIIPHLRYSHLSSVRDALHGTMMLFPFLSSLFHAISVVICLSLLSATMLFSCA